MEARVPVRAATWATNSNTIESRAVITALHYPQEQGIEKGDDYDPIFNKNTEAYLKRME
jgi:hypothetical protein